MQWRWRREITETIGGELWAVLLSYSADSTGLCEHTLSVGDPLLCIFGGASREALDAELTWSCGYGLMLFQEAQQWDRIKSATLHHTTTELAKLVSPNCGISFWGWELNGNVVSAISSSVRHSLLNV